VFPLNEERGTSNIKLEGSISSFSQALPFAWARSFNPFHSSPHHHPLPSKPSYVHFRYSTPVHLMVQKRVSNFTIPLYHLWLFNVLPLFFSTPPFVSGLASETVPSTLVQFLWPQYASSSSLPLPPVHTSAHSPQESLKQICGM